MLHKRCFGVELSGSFGRDKKQYGGTLLDTILKYINQSLSCGNFVKNPLHYHLDLNLETIYLSVSTH